LKVKINLPTGLKKFSLGNKVKRILKTALKFIITGLALYFVFSKISWSQVSELLLSSNVFLLILAAIFFIISKILSAYRLQGFFKCIDLILPTRYNLKLYWIGMFYNLFLPGGIGGDGYKVYLLNKEYGTKVKPLIQASLIDRVSGLASLVFLAGLGFLLLDLTSFPEWMLYADIAGLLLLFPILYIFTNIFFKAFTSFLIHSMFWSLSVQLMQVVSAILILFSLGVLKNQIAYEVLFLISSFVSILPFTIGGLGSREFTFLLGHQYFGIDEAVSIALSLLFTLITAIVSFGGVFIKPTDNWLKS